jgi:hypothetical protein
MHVPSVGSLISTYALCSVAKKQTASQVKRALFLESVAEQPLETVQNLPPPSEEVGLCIFYRFIFMFSY